MGDCMYSLQGVYPGAFMYLMILIMILLLVALSKSTPRYQGLKAPSKHAASFLSLEAIRSNFFGPEIRRHSSLGFLYSSFLEEVRTGLDLVQISTELSIV